MKYTLLVIFCALSLASSAQFWKKKKPAPIAEVVYPRFPEVEQPRCLASVNVANDVTMPGVYNVTFKRSVYDIELAEEEVMKQAKHNMRFGIFKVASYNFSDLASLYVLQNRFSEAKWFFLQSNEISREQKDHKHTIANLLCLADIKLAIGETPLAKADLQEARELALVNGLTVELAALDSKLHGLESSNMPILPKATLRYAQAVEASNKQQ